MELCVFECFGVIELILVHLACLFVIILLMMEIGFDVAYHN